MTRACSGHTDVDLKGPSTAVYLIVSWREPDLQNTGWRGVSDDLQNTGWRGVSDDFVLERKTLGEISH